VKKLLVICGPTATGKTKLGIYLAKKLKGELISADSRQVFRGMDIGTGKELSASAKFEFRSPELGGHYKIAGINIWGYDLVSPKKDFNVSEYIKFTRVIIDNIWSRDKLPILTGGTGLYIKALTDGIETISIPRNEKLRKTYADKSRDELFEILASIDSIKAASLNSSDKRNPRRLIRAIEIALDNSKRNGNNSRGLGKFKSKLNILFIGLFAPKVFLDEKIKERVKDRVKKGIKKEIEKLLKEKVSWKSQSMSSLGYKQWRDFFEGKANQEEVISLWEREERKYAKRQLTWFKKDNRINWFDISKRGWKKSVEKLVEKW